jgi:SNF2 family DNA or RNA helicase
MKETNEVENLIKQFAPRANDSLEEPEENYDVFISTDAHGVGVNMQDASVVINYDIDWTPIGPIQRAGRILRFWHSPRTVDLYTFVPILLTPQNQLRSDLTKVMQRWNNLIKRHGESRKLIDLAVLTEQGQQILNLPDLASQVTIKQGQLDLEDLADLEISPYFKHTAKLQENRDYASQIPSDIISAKTYLGSNPLIYILLKYKNKYYRVVYDVKNQKIDEPNEVKLLNLIECTSDTPIAVVEKDLIEELSDVCIQTWCNQKEINSEEVVRECALYLKPEQEADTIKSLLESA